MNRYITVPPDVVLIDPNTNAPMDGSVPFEKSVAALFNDQRLIGALDVFTLIELRKKLMAAKHGDPPVQITEEEWNALLPCVKRPTIFHPSFIYAGEDFFRAFLDAPTKAPNS